MKEKMFLFFAKKFQGLQTRQMNYVNVYEYLFVYEYVYVYVYVYV